MSESVIALARQGLGSGAVPCLFEHEHEHEQERGESLFATAFSLETLISDVYLSVRFNRTRTLELVLDLDLEWKCASRRNRYEYRSQESEVRISDCGFRTPNSELRTSNPKPRTRRTTNAADCVLRLTTGHKGV